MIDGKLDTLIFRHQSLLPTSYVFYNLMEINNAQKY
jgi:hypothetical protein